jgi:prevent-host-death family protein
MAVAPSRVEVGVKDLKNNLSHYLEVVQTGDKVIVTHRGRPIAVISAMEPPTDRLAELIAAGVARPPVNRTRHRLGTPIRAKGPVSDLVADQRR